MDRAVLSPLMIFAAVARHRSFRAAGRELGLSPSSVSHAVAGLEARLGLRLVARTTRSVAPTAAGERLLARLGPAFAEISSALIEIGEEAPEPGGPLRVTAPRSGLGLAILPRLSSFLEAYPRIELEIVTEEGLVDLVAGGFDAGLRLGEALEQDMVAVAAGPPLSLAAMAAPSYLARHGMPRAPEDLSRHRVIQRRFSNGALYRWEFGREGRWLTILPPPAVVVDDDLSSLEAAASGIGITMVLDGRAEAHLAAGRLVRVLEDWCPSFPGFHICYTTRRQMRPALRAFVDHFRWRG